MSLITKHREQKLIVGAMSKVSSSLSSSAPYLTAQDRRDARHRAAHIPVYELFHISPYSVYGQGGEGDACANEGHGLRTSIISHYSINITITIAPAEVTSFMTKKCSLTAAVSRRYTHLLRSSKDRRCSTRRGVFWDNCGGKGDQRVVTR